MPATEGLFGDVKGVGRKGWDLKVPRIGCIEKPGRHGFVRSPPGDSCNKNGSSTRQTQRIRQNHGWTTGWGGVDHANVRVVKQ